MRHLVYLFLTVIFLFFSSISLASADGQIFFMKANSTAKITQEYTISTVGNWTLWNGISQYPYDSGLQNYPIIEKIESPSLNVTTYQSKYDVTYTITAKNNATGIYTVNAGYCDATFPIVVGLNESAVKPQIFKSYFAPRVEMGCNSLNTPEITSVKIIGYTGLVPKLISANYSNWENSMESASSPEFPFVIPIFLISIASLILFYRIKIRTL